MSGYSTPVRTELDERVREVIAEVLMIGLNSVHPESVLIDDLGAESIDFLDLVFRIEEITKRPIPVTVWEEYVRTEATRKGGKLQITVGFVQGFAADQVRT